MAEMQWTGDPAEAQRLDRQDALARFRERFHIPRGHDGAESVYLCGNSLGLQPKKAAAYVNESLEDWARLGVDGHFEARHPWLPYHENLTADTARVVGALPIEVVVMNTLTVNLHLMMVSFFRPAGRRRKIITGSQPFPSDRYAVASQALFHGLDPQTTIVELRARPGEENLRTEDIERGIAEAGDELALVLMDGVNYLTGEALDMQAISRAAHAAGAMVGFDLAHAAGNLMLKLHDWDVDFAVWCSYKYLNGGPGCLGGCFVHERHASRADLPRFSGWWGHDKKTRFQMGPVFSAIPGAEGWQLSNPPILPMAALRASLEIFSEAGMQALRNKSELLTAYLEFLIARSCGDRVQVITPSVARARGCQLSLRVKSGGKRVFERVLGAGMVCDWREPDVIRVAPVPLYNSFWDVFRFGTFLGEATRAQ